MDERCKNCAYAIIGSSWNGYKCKLNLKIIRNPNKLAWCNYFRPRKVNRNKAFQ